MVLRDFYCAECESVVADVVVDAISVTTIRLDCPECVGPTLHHALCNGGTRSRYRFQDLPSNRDWYKGQTRALGVSVNGKEVLNNGDDKREARRDRAYYDQRKRYGSNTLVFDQKRNNA